MKWVGHDSVAMVLRYAKARQLGETLKGLDALLPIGKDSGK